MELPNPELWEKRFSDLYGWLKQTEILGWGQNANSGNVYDQLSLIYNKIVILAPVSWEMFKNSFVLLTRIRSFTMSSLTKIRNPTGRQVVPKDNES